MKLTSKIILTIIASSVMASNAMALTSPKLSLTNKVESVVHHGSFDGSGGAGNNAKGNGNGSGNGTDGNNNGSGNH